MKIDERVMTFGENVHTALWGTERWLVSAHASAPSTIASGPHAGRRLDEVAPGFPLLVKEIDARTRLSVQVHPNEITKKTVGGDAKTEMWCALDDGRVYAGLKPGTTPADIRVAVEDGSFERLMVCHDLKAGDVIFVPGGLVHAICDNTRIYEVQQSSDTTFRLYDWGRKGPDGQPRTLHVAEALRSIDYTLPPPVKTDRASCPFFDFRRVRVDGEAAVSGRGFTVLYAFRGAFALGGVTHAEGSSVLVAPGADFTVCGDGAEIFVTKGDER